MTKHVAVVGAGLGGLRAAEQLRAAGHTGPVTVFGAEPHVPYSRPPLSKELLAHELADAEAAPGADADDLAALLERVAFRRRASAADVAFRLGAPVTAADLGAGELTVAGGATVRFDGLVAATGLRPRRLRVPGPDGPGSGRHVLRTLDDCASLRAGLRAALARSGQSGPGRAGAAGGGLPRPRVVVVGGGFVGCEVACTARSLGCDVTVVEPLGPPMLRVLGEPVARAVQRAHEQAGISFVTGRAVAGYAGQDRVTGVVVTGPVSTGAASAGLVSAGPLSTDAANGGLAELGTVLPADLVVEAIGSLPNTEWLAGNGLDLTDGVLCDNSLSVVTAAPRPGAGGPEAAGTLLADPMPADPVLAETVLADTVLANTVPANTVPAGPVLAGAVSPGTVPATAVGDLARFPNPLVDDVPRRVEHWSMPTDTARRAAATLVARLGSGQVDPLPFCPLPYFWSDQGDLRLQSFGSPQLADDLVIAEGDLGALDRGLLATYHRGGRLIGSLAVNLPPTRYRELRQALAAR